MIFTSADLGKCLVAAAVGVCVGSGVTYLVMKHKDKTEEKTMTVEEFMADSDHRKPAKTDVVEVKSSNSSIKAVKHDIGEDPVAREVYMNYKVMAKVDENEDHPVDSDEEDGSNDINEDNEDINDFDDLGHDGGDENDIRAVEIDRNAPSVYTDKVTYNQGLPGYEKRDLVWYIDDDTFCTADEFELVDNWKKFIPSDAREQVINRCNSWFYVKCPSNMILYRIQCVGGDYNDYLKDLGSL